MLRIVLIEAAENLADRDKLADFTRVMAELETTFSTDPDWPDHRMRLLARGGKLADALKTAKTAPDPDAARARVLGFAVDRAVRLNTFGDLPEELRDSFKAVINAFKKYEIGHDDPARSLLDSVGMRSPLSDWKLLIRGLIAAAADDTVRALENWQRLDQTRLPSRLAAPYRVAIDPEYKAGLLESTVAKLLKQLESLRANPVVDSLRRIGRALGQDRKMRAGFQEMATALPTIKHSAPFLMPRLANCFYAAILRYGEPEDLAKYRTIFGNPVGDPHFYRLQALICEDIQDEYEAIDYWKKYEAWLATGTSGWAADAVTRARASIWTRIGGLIDKLGGELEDVDDDDDDFDDRYSRRRRAKAQPKQPVEMTTEACYRRGLALDPKWEVPNALLFRVLLDAENYAEAEIVGKAFLDQDPKNHKAVLGMATLYQSWGRTAEAAGYWLRGLALNPLDAATRSRTAAAILGSASKLLAEGKLPNAESVLAEHQTLLTETMPGVTLGLRSVLSMSAGRSSEAEAFRTQALAVPGARLVAAYRMAVDSILARLKPADKKAAEAAFARELQGPATPAEFAGLLGTLASFRTDGIKYYGQKTHEKKILEAVPRSVVKGANEEELEQVGDQLLDLNEWGTAKKFFTTATHRFPNNPALTLGMLNVMVARGSQPYRLMPLLMKIKQLLAASTETRHQKLQSRVDELIEKMSPRMDPFLAALIDSFNSRFGGMPDGFFGEPPDDDDFDD